MPKVTMPQLGESVAEGTIGKWLKQVGEHVDKYEPIVEVITDKVNAEVPSPFAGTLTAILVQEGETVPNNAEIAEIDGEGAAPSNGSAPSGAVTTSTRAAEATPAAEAHGPAGSDERPAPMAAPTAPRHDPAEYEGRLTPAVRRLAREHDIDLALVTGTGHAGRITREDILGYVEAQRSVRAQAPAPSPAAAAGSASAAASRPVAPAPVTLAADSLKPQTPMRKAIAAQMTRALAVPVAYTLVEVDMSAVIARREAAKAEYQAREGMNLSFVAFVTKAAVEALRAHPDLNAHYTEEGHWRRKAINVGVAVAVDDGLVVPVIRDADSLSVHGLNRAINETATRARANKLRLDDVSGGTFTVDNTGWTGSVVTQPIINVPEVAILTMEAIVRRPVVVDAGSGEAIAIRPMMNMVLGFDHRATDGAQAGRFIADVKRWLESVSPETPIW
ncbi:MAG TPA: dihydrolipoamide acetyltransferase family protein [Candidatus Sulfotelmatobacter sp.]|nr:dihydrolipoamide acetyltransferase family protein [Candidatus Sulfotelmatobacter sp.]